MVSSTKLPSTNMLRFERTFGRDAYCHLFVTDALENFLVKNWHLR